MVQTRLSVSSLQPVISTHFGPLRLRLPALAILVTAYLLLADVAACAAQPHLFHAKVDSLLNARHDAGTLHGAVAIGREGDVLYTGGWGDAHRDRGISNEASTRFLIGSLTKQFTATLILTLVREGDVDLNASASTLLPRYDGPGAERITVHHLLAHRSGLPSFADVRAAARGESGDAISLDFEPGADYAYSNAGYVLLGLIAEAVTKQTYASALRERVLIPAGIAGEIGYASDGHATEGLATGYASPWWRWGYHPVDGVPAEGPFSAGMMYATPRALVTWAHALHDGAVLPDSLVRAMTTPYSESGYGYGVFVETTGGDDSSATVIHHGGGIPGFTAALRHVQLEDGTSYTIAVLDNTQSDATVQTATDLQALLLLRQ